MKKIILMAAMFAATVCNAQVTLWNGDDKEVGSDGGFWDRATPTVVEEEGNKVMKFTLKASTSGWDKEQCNFALPLGDADFKGVRRMTMRIKMGVNHNVMVKIVKDGTYSATRWFWCGNPDQWNILTFEFAKGPESDKITDTGNTVLEIWPFEDGADAISNIGQVVYIDDIKMEGTMVGGKGVVSYDDNSITGDVTATGVIGKGTYQCTWDGDWHSESYDDYALLASKLASTVTKLDVKDAGRWDEDWTAIRNKCNGIKISPVDDETAITEVSAEKPASASETYNVAGQRVSPSAKGLIIQNGHKIMK